MEKYLWIIYCYNLAPAALCAALTVAVYVPVRAIWLKARHIRRRPVSAEIARALFAGYIAALVNIVWIPVPEFIDMLFNGAEQFSELFANGTYVHGCEIFDCLFGGAGVLPILEKFEILANIVLFVPFGFLMPIAFRRLKWWQTDLICIGTTCTIELVQPMLGRACDLDDVIANALGGIIGCAAAKLFLTIFGGERGDQYEEQRFSTSDDSRPL